MNILPEVAAIFGKVDFDPDTLHRKYLSERDKRLRDDGNEQYVEVKAEFSRYVEDPYVEPGFTRAPVFDEVRVRDHRRRLRRPADGRAPARGRLQEPAHGRERRRFRRHLVLEPLSRRDVRRGVVLLPAAARRARLHAEAQILVRAGDPRAQPSASRGTTASTTTRCCRRPSPSLALGRSGRALDRQHQPRRPIHGAVHRDGERPAAAGRSCRASPASTSSRATRSTPAAGTTATPAATAAASARS